MYCTDILPDCINSGEFDHELYNENSRYNLDETASDGFDNVPGAEHRDASYEHPCLALKKILSDGTFYYSVDFDLTNRLQNRYDMVDSMVL